MISKANSFLYHKKSKSYVRPPSPKSDGFPRPFTLDFSKIFSYATKRDIIESFVEGWIMDSTHEARDFFVQEKLPTRPHFTFMHRHF